MKIQKARREQQKAVVGLIGASGSGKTLSALRLAYGMMTAAYPEATEEERWEKVGVIDTEHRRAMIYAGQQFDEEVGEIGGFLHIDLTAPYSTKRYIDALHALIESGCEVIIVDSLSHNWNGEGGITETHASMSGNSFQNWGKLSSETNRLIRELTTKDVHILATMRTKTEYVVELNEKGKMSPRKVGTKPIQKEDFEYEFLINFTIDENGTAVATKDNSHLFDEPRMLTEEDGENLYRWLEKGVDVKREIEETRLKLVAILDEKVKENEELLRPHLQDLEMRARTNFTEWNIKVLQRAIEIMNETLESVNVSEADAT